MIPFAHADFLIALLVIAAGLRLAAFVYERLTAPARVDGPPEAAPVALMPDATPDNMTVISAAPSAQETAASPTRLPQVLYEFLDSFIIALVLVVFVINPFIVQAFVIPSGSMNNTLMQEDKLIATKYSYYLAAPRRGDVVVFYAPRVALELSKQEIPANGRVEYVKRVVGVPGDHIRIVANEGVYVNGKLLDEPYARTLPNYDFPLSLTGDVMVPPEVRDALLPHIEGRELVVPGHALFVLGDNRDSSHDGHVWGLLPRKNVVGKASFIFWPPPRIRVIR